jgi:hypothetical protein
MKQNKRKRLRKELGAIFDTIVAPNTRPRAIMEANRVNSSSPWNEAEDARRFDQAIPEMVESFDRAVAYMTSPSSLPRKKK